MPQIETRILPQSLDNFRLLTTEQVAALLNVEISTVWRLRGRRVDPLPTVMIGKRNRRFKQNEVLEWLSRQSAKREEAL